VSSVKYSRRTETVLQGFTGVTTALVATQLLDISNKLDTLIRKTIDPSELRMLLDEIRQTLATVGTPTPADIKALLTKLDELKQALQTPRAWSNDVIVGTPTPLDGVVGSNVISVGEGKDVDYDVSNKYLASIIFELEEYTIGDYVKEVRATNGTDTKILIKNLSLAYANKEVEFLAPVYIPQGYWLEVELNLATAKKFTIALEVVY